MNSINIDNFINRNHIDFFNDTTRTYIFYGGAGAGKSFSICDKLLLETTRHRNHNKKLKFLVIRKTFPSLRRTCMAMLEERASVFKIPYDINKSEFVARVNGNTDIYFLSMHNKGDYDKVKSITDVDIIWIEEANELSENAFDLLDLRLRGSQGTYKQIILSFNPVGMTSWIFQRFFTSETQNTVKRQTNVYENPFIDKEYVQKLEGLANTNKMLHRVYCLGEWGQLQGVVYDNWQIVDELPAKVDEVIYGCDFGFNNPSAMVRITISDRVYYLEEIFYKSKRTNKDLIAFIKSGKVGKARIYCDSAEPQRIEEMTQAGINAHPANKKVAVKTQIDFVKTLDLRILEGSENLIKEIQSYVWAEDSEGRATDEPVKFQDHLCDSMRYALFTHIAKSFKFESIGPDGLKST